MQQKPKKLTVSQQVIYHLSQRLIKAQQPIRILDSIKWHPEISHEFFRKKCQEQPAVDKAYYDQHPLRFNLEKKREEFYDIEREIKNKLGQFSGIGNILLRMCREYRSVIRMLGSRGTPEFAEISKELYGSVNDVFYAGGPTLGDLGEILSRVLSNIGEQTQIARDVKRYSASDAMEMLSHDLREYFFDDKDRVKVILSDGILSDAAAGAETLKLRDDSMFSERDIQLLKVHEGWVHIGTTINGLEQPICTFLSKGPPSSTIYQEGLAIIMEIFSFTAHPHRMQKLTNRILATRMAESGATFLDVFRYNCEHGLTQEESYINTTRIFRGSTPTLGPFTKDLSYNKGFILIYNYIRLAIQSGYVKRIPLLFLGKTSLEDLKTYEYLLEDGTLTYPKYIPKPFDDIAALSCWMSYSLFLNKLDLDSMAENYRTIL